MNKVLLAIFAFTIILNAQDITNKLGGNTANETYDVTDSADNLLFRVQGDNGILFNGTFGTGTIPATGAGTRMMWYPSKAAFRVGYVNGTQWNDGNIGNYSTAMGMSTTASGYASTAMGQGTTASENASTAMGQGTTASGDYSTAMGLITTASGDYSTAMGYQTTASGDYSTAMGQGTTASGYNSTAMGLITTASGGYSTAMGYQTTASGGSSTAMGFNTTASGESSTAMGRSTTASGDYSTAMGRSTTASGNYSTAMGQGIEASGDYSVAIALSDQSGTDVTQANTMAIMGGRVGIGEIAPDFPLHIYSSSIPWGGNDVHHIKLEVANGWWTMGVDNESGDADFFFRSSEDTDGYTAFIDPTSGNWQITSDKRFKKNILPLSNILDRIQKLEPVTYHRLKQDDGELREIGFLAQDVKKLFPDTKIAKLKGDYWTLAYNNFGPIAIAGIKELKEEKDKEIQELREINKQLIARIEKLENQ